MPKNLLARGALGSLGIKIATVGLAFLAQLLLARLMGASQYGLYIYALTWLNVGVLVARLGTDGLLTRLAAAYVVEQRWALLQGLIRFGYRTVFLASVGLGLVAWLGLGAAESALGLERYLTFVAALPLLPLSALWGVGQALLFGLKRPWRAQLPEPLGRVFMLLLAGAAYWQWGALSSVTTMLCTVVAGLVVLVIGTVWLNGALPAPATSAAPAFAARDWRAVALPLWWMALLRLLLSQSDILLIGWLLADAKAAGIYAVATRLADLASFGLQAANTVLAPMISELYTTRQTERLQALVTQSARGIFTFTLVISLILSFSGEYILGLFGAEFVTAYRPLLILLCGQIVNALTGSVGYLMTMTGHQRQAARLVALSAVVTVSLNGLLIPRFGLEGAALATATGTGALNLAMLVFVGSRLKINSTVFGKKSYGTA